MSTATNIKDIPKNDFDSMKEKVFAQLNKMSQDELEIVAKSRESLAKTIKILFEEVANVMGYIITYPIALALGVANSIVDGFSKGASQAWKDVMGDD